MINHRLPRRLWRYLASNTEDSPILSNTEAQEAMAYLSLQSLRLGLWQGTSPIPDNLLNLFASNKHIVSA